MTRGAFVRAAVLELAMVRGRLTKVSEADYALVLAAADRLEEFRREMTIAEGALATPDAELARMAEAIADLARFGR